MSALDLVRFDVPGFALRGDTEGMRIWNGPQGDGIGLSFDAAPSGFPADLSVPTAVRDYARTAAAASGMGLVEADPVALDGCRALRSIAKQPQQPGGMHYLGLLILPAGASAYVLRVQCEEHGITGMRDSLVLDALLGSGQIDLSKMEGDVIPGWAQDPYEPGLTTLLPRNLSEDPRYDAQFPDHPLSRVRMILQQIQHSASIAPEVKKASA